MRKKIILCILCCLLLITGCFSEKKSHTQENLTSNESLSEEEKLLKKVEDILSKMTREEKIGQMLVISYRSPNFDKKLEQTLEEVQPGGFILFKENIESYEQTTNLIQKIKETAKIPMLIGIDQEGGNVQRIKKLPDANVLTIPYMYDLGLTQNSDLSYQVGTVIGEELAAFGINLDYAPTIDIYSNPQNKVIGKRAFGSDSETVIKMAFPFINGLKNSGIIPVVKHFPGHGDTITDSHKELPIVTKTKEELYQNELKPFVEAVRQNVDMIMVAHISLPNVTGNKLPASLSKEIITDLLRNEMGYQGIVTTDAVDMKALSNHYTTKEICEKAINAGVDMILMPQESKVAAAAIKELLQEQKIQERQIDESVKRILLLKYKNKLDQEKELSKDMIGNEEHQKIIEQIKNN